MEAHTQFCNRMAHEIEDSQCCLSLLWGLRGCCWAHSIFARPCHIAVGQNQHSLLALLVARGMLSLHCYRCLQKPTQQFSLLWGWKLSEKNTNWDFGAVINGVLFMMDLCQYCCLHDPVSIWWLPCKTTKKIQLWHQALWHHWDIELSGPGATRYHSQSAASWAMTTGAPTRIEKQLLLLL